MKLIKSENFNEKEIKAAINSIKKILDVENYNLSVKFVFDVKSKKFRYMFSVTNKNRNKLKTFNNIYASNLLDVVKQLDSLHCQVFYDSCVNNSLDLKIRAFLDGYEYDCYISQILKSITPKVFKSYQNNLSCFDNLDELSYLLDKNIALDLVKYYNNNSIKADIIGYHNKKYIDGKHQTDQLYNKKYVDKQFKWFPITYYHNDKVYLTYDCESYDFDANTFSNAIKTAIANQTIDTLNGITILGLKEFISFHFNDIFNQWETGNMTKTSMLSCLDEMFHYTTPQYLEYLGYSNKIQKIKTKIHQF